MKLIGTIQGFNKTKSYSGYARVEEVKSPMAVVGTINTTKAPVVGKAPKQLTADQLMVKRLKKTAVFAGRTIKTFKAL